jgi:hypothetical protein
MIVTSKYEETVHVFSPISHPYSPRKKNLTTKHDPARRSLAAPHHHDEKCSHQATREVGTAGKKSQNEVHQNLEPSSSAVGGRIIILHAQYAQL